MNDSQLHQQIGRLTEAVESTSLATRELSLKMSTIGEKVEQVDRKLSEMSSNMVTKESLRAIGIDLARPDEHHADMAWLRAKRLSSEKRTPVYSHAFKAVAAAVAIAVCTWLWQAVNHQVAKDVRVEIRNEQSK